MFCYSYLANALAQQASSKIEEIIVTAEKRSEPLNEVSQSISVFDTDQLGDLHADTLVDLNALAPGVNIAKNEGFRTVVTIRGVGNEANQNTIANPSVSFHLDGIYMASPFTLQTDLLDIERVEVIRGPQGALFGQNSTGGAINVVSVSPGSRRGFERSLGHTGHLWPNQDVRCSELARWIQCCGSSICNCEST